MARSIKVVADGITFDSKGEYRRYQDLCLLQRAGEISDLTVHPTYELIPAFVNIRGERIRAITYTADFRYMEDYTTIVEDFKSPASKTQAYELRKKLFQYRYQDIEFRETSV